jgi:hypothetical protein
MAKAPIPASINVMLSASVWSENVAQIDPSGAGSYWHISSMSCSISGFAIPLRRSSSTIFTMS